MTGKLKTHCLNCSHPIEDKYCAHCGQRTDLGRITWKHFAEEFIHTITHGERSILTTTWQLIIRPGKSLDAYLGGQRRKFHSPVGFFLIWVTLSILTHRATLALSGFHPVLLEGLTFSHEESVHAFVVHGELFYILCFPVEALLFFIILGRPVYSYIESIVITMYVFSMTYVFHIVCYLLGGLVLGLNVLHWAFYLFQIIISLVYSVWVSYTLFKPRAMRLLWLRILLHLVISSVVILQLLEWMSDLWVRWIGGH
jgi:hypothetical protein